MILKHVWNIQVCTKHIIAAQDNYLFPNNTFILIFQLLGQPANKTSTEDFKRAANLAVQNSGLDTKLGLTATTVNYYSSLFLSHLSTTSRIGKSRLISSFSSSLGLSFLSKLTA